MADPRTKDPPPKPSRLRVASNPSTPQREEPVKPSVAANSSSETPYRRPVPLPRPRAVTATGTTKVLSTNASHSTAANNSDLNLSTNLPKDVSQSPLAKSNINLPVKPQRVSPPAPLAKPANLQVATLPLSTTTGVAADVNSAAPGPSTSVSQLPLDPAKTHSSPQLKVVKDLATVASRKDLPQQQLQRNQPSLSKRQQLSDAYSNYETIRRPAPTAPPLLQPIAARDLSKSPTVSNDHLSSSQSTYQQRQLQQHSFYNREEKREGGGNGGVALLSGSQVFGSPLVNSSNGSNFSGQYPTTVLDTKGATRTLDPSYDPTPQSTLQLAISQLKPVPQENNASPTALEPLQQQPHQVLIQRHNNNSLATGLDTHQSSRQNQTAASASGFHSNSNSNPSSSSPKQTRQLQRSGVTHYPPQQVDAADSLSNVHRNNGSSLGISAAADGAYNDNSIGSNGISSFGNGNGSGSHSNNNNGNSGTLTASLYKIQALAQEQSERVRQINFQEKKMDIAEVVQEKSMLWKLRGAEWGGMAKKAWEERGGMSSLAGGITDHWKHRDANTGYGFRQSRGTVDRIFGIPLADATRLSQISASMGVPAVVTRCIEYLDVMGPDEVGLYRVPGVSSVVAKLKALFDHGQDYDFLQKGNGPHDPHAVATLLKLYLRELPSTIIPTDLLPGFVSINSLDHGQLREHLKLLPLENYLLLSTLCHHLSQFAEYEDVTKMNISNLGLIFCPTLQIGSILFKGLLGGGENDEERRKGMQEVWHDRNGRKEEMENLEMVKEFENGALLDGGDGVSLEPELGPLQHRRQPLQSLAPPSPPITRVEKSMISEPMKPDRHQLQHQQQLFNQQKALLWQQQQNEAAAAAAAASENRDGWEQLPTEPVLPIQLPVSSTARGIRNNFAKQQNDALKQYASGSGGPVGAKVINSSLVTSEKPLISPVFSISSGGGSGGNVASTLPLPMSSALAGNTNFQQERRSASSSKSSSAEISGLSSLQKSTSSLSLDNPVTQTSATVYSPSSPPQPPPPPPLIDLYDELMARELDEATNTPLSEQMNLDRSFPYGGVVTLAGGGRHSREPATTASGRSMPYPRGLPEPLIPLSPPSMHTK